MPSELSRREALAAMALGAAAPAAPLVDAAAARHDELVERALKLQITDPQSRWAGSIADESGLHHATGAGSLLETLVAAYLQPASKFHHDRTLIERVRLAAKFLERSQSGQGNISLLTTNFNSPPDTGFVVHPAGTAACLAHRGGEREIVGLLEPFLRKAGAGMAEGGIHTPNHRWVVCSALAQINEVFPDAAFTQRIGQWLAEGIDIDEDGQYTERSTLTYSIVCNRALIVMAAKLKRPELLEPVRRNLNALLYLLHPGDEVVTEISRRQDQYRRGSVGVYWFSLRYLAVHDGNGQFAALADRYAAANASLPALMEYPELAGAGPAHAALPEDYEKLFPAMQVARIRRGLTSATMLLGGNSRFLSLRRGDAVIDAVRFATAFFGKGQFVPQRAEKRGESYEFAQVLRADYMQPTNPPRTVTTTEWEAAKAFRRRSELCTLEQTATVTERKNGFRVRLRAQGTDGVPLAVEISLRPGGQLAGCTPVRGSAEKFLLNSRRASYRVGPHEIRFGPGMAEHAYTDVRGAEARLPGTSVYLTGYTPFDHTLEFDWGA